MTCAEAEPLIGASLDGELDAHTALEVERHISECRGCEALFGRLERLRGEIAASGADWSSSVDLRPLAAAIRRRSGSGRSRIWKAPWLWQPALGAVAGALLVMVLMTGRSTGSLERQMVDNHIRSLLAGHLVDVPSSDHHTVKPWFQGKLNFAPAVPDLAAEGFVLTGGRLDVIGGRPAAAIVYKRREHVVNLWIAPDGGSDRDIEPREVDGFHLLHWRKDQMAYWAISDVNESELREFAERIRGR
jgi:anti-sigma factor RsiW